MHSDMPYIKMPGQAGIPFWNQKDIAEEKIKEIDPEIYEFRKRLYDREDKVKFSPGTLLLYRVNFYLLRTLRALFITEKKIKTEYFSLIFVNVFYEK